jgi:hypothetical protein
MIRYLLSLVVSLVLFPTFAQFNISDNYLYEVKQIGQFIDRFNDQDFQFKKQLIDNQDDSNLSRPNLIYSLFEHETNQWDTIFLNKFVTDVCSETNPLFLHSSDSNWYAEVECTFLYNEKPKDLTLILQNETCMISGFECSKWVITNAFIPFLSIPQSKDPNAVLSPVSEGTNFIGLYEALTVNGANIRNYFPTNYQPDILSVFMNEVWSGRLTLQSVNKIKYHFLQLPGWILCVEQFNRTSRNSGWLISYLQEADKNVKTEYLLKNHLMNLKCITYF